MAYANTTSKRDQVLEALRANMDAITPPDYEFDVKRALIMRGAQAVKGGEMPTIVVIPAADERTQALACAVDEYSMSVEIFGALRVNPTGDAWRSQAHLLVADIQFAINQDRQLGGSAVYVEVDSTDIADAEVLGGRSLALVRVDCTVVYRISVSDPTT